MSVNLSNEHEMCMIVITKQKEGITSNCQPLQILRFFQSIMIVNLLSLLMTSIWVNAFTGWFDWIVLLNCL